MSNYGPQLRAPRQSTGPSSTACALLPCRDVPPRSSWLLNPCSMSLQQPLPAAATPHTGTPTYSPHNWLTFGPHPNRNLSLRRAQVNPYAPLSLLHDLGRHPAGRAYKSHTRRLLVAPRPAALQRRGHAKVGKAHVAVAVDQDVASLHAQRESGRRPGRVGRRAAVQEGGVWYCRQVGAMRRKVGRPCMWGYRYHARQHMHAHASLKKGTRQPVAARA